MIDTFNERMLNVDEATAHFSKICKRERNRHVVLRWMNRGCSGVVLETVRIGREIYTSAEAVNRFANRVAAKKRELHGFATTEDIAGETQLAEDLDKQAAELGI